MSAGAVFRRQNRRSANAADAKPGSPAVGRSGTSRRRGAASGCRHRRARRFRRAADLILRRRRRELFPRVVRRLPLRHRTVGRVIVSGAAVVVMMVVAVTMIVIVAMIMRLAVLASPVHGVPQ